jgi:hypothetical protein
MGISWEFFLQVFLKEIYRNSQFPIASIFAHCQNGVERILIFGMILSHNLG